MPDVYPEGLVTGYFGSLTEKAVKRFQTKYGIEQTGFVGPQTRSKLNSLILSQELQLYHCPSASSTNCTPPPGGFSQPQKPSLSANNNESSSTPSKNLPHIIFLSQSTGPVGTLVTINGTGFIQSGNDIHFDDGGTRNVNAGDNGTALTFIIPSSVGGCYWGSTSTICNEPIKPIIPGGSYPISVKNTYGISNSIFFQYFFSHYSYCSCKFKYFKRATPDATACSTAATATSSRVCFKYSFLCSGKNRLFFCLAACFG